eukprot:gene19674-26359_t
MDPASPTCSVQHDKDIDYIYSAMIDSGFLDAFGLAVNIMDRFTETLKKGRPSNAEVFACCVLATAVLTPDYHMDVKFQWTKMAVIDVLRNLRFEMYADTCDWLLKTSHGHPNIVFALLKKIVKESGGNTAKSVEMYLARRDFIDLSNM